MLGGGLVFFSPLPVGVPHQLATLKRACGFFLKKQHVAAHSPLERLWELLSAGIVAVVGKARFVVLVYPPCELGLVEVDACPAESHGPSSLLHSHTCSVVAGRC